MVMTYGDIDKSKERRNDLNLIITNLTKVTAAWDTLNLKMKMIDPTSGEDTQPLEKLIKDSLKSALKLKGDG